ncbi:MAG: N-acetylglucosamine-6-phosphate deacetylase [Armatimonadota bacterium]
MSKCPKCGTENDVVASICDACGAELPAPYETALADEPEEGYFVKEDVDENLGTGADPASAYGMAAAAMARFSPDQLTVLAGATIFVGDEEITPATVIVADGRILDVLRGAMPDPANGAKYIDLTGRTLTPGFIEIHFHGLMGIDTNQASVDDFLRMSAEAAKHGLTVMTPTTVACPAAELRRVLENLRKARARGFPGANLIGLHLESNFISMEKKGAQPQENIFAPNDPQAGEMMQVIDEYQDDVRIVTMASELPGALGLIEWLRERDIIVSLGHSMATYEEAIAGFDAGATHATHLFNAMPPLNHREPGLVGAALERDDVFTEMVCDGVHVHPAVISAVITAKGGERFVPVSDSLEGAGLGEGEEFYLGGQHVTVRNGVARLDSGTIAGSIVTMDGVVRVLVERVGWALSEALHMCATTPADALELDVIGRLVPGAVANLTVLDPNLNVTMTMVSGKVVYQA